MIIKYGYLARKTTGKGRKGSKQQYRDWFLVKSAGNGISGIITLQAVCIPPILLGRKVRFKLEVVHDQRRDS